MGCAVTPWLPRVAGLTTHALPFGPTFLSTVSVNGPSFSTLSTAGKILVAVDGTGVGVEDGL